MNIAKIINFSSFTTNNIQPKNSNYNTKFGLKMSAPLSCDTVSFGATRKELTEEDKTNGVNLSTAAQAREIALPMQAKARAFADKLWGKYLVTEMNPLNPVLKICDRCKSALSIKEKSQSRDFRTRQEVLEKMTDINGVKIVMRDSRMENVDKILGELRAPIMSGEIELLEIENKRPMAVKGLKGKELTKYDYASEALLNELAELQNAKNDTKQKTKGKKVRVDMDDFTEINYCAVHMLLRLKGEKRPFELTLMGSNISELKDLDDKLFKILKGKEVDPAYEPIKKLVKPLTQDGNQESLEKFNNYRAEAMLFQRKKAASSFAWKNNGTPYFLPMSEDLDPRLDLNELYKLMLRCDKAAEKKEENK